MGDSNRIQPGTLIQQSLWEKFRNDVQTRKGSIRGHLQTEVERALREYIRGAEGGDTHDRLKRIENDLEEIHEAVADDSHGQGKNKKDSNVSKTVENRIEKIEKRVQREAGEGTIHEAVVQEAIEDIAGYSEPTIRRYKEILTSRNILWPHPVQEKKFVHDDEEFVKMTQQFARNGAIPDDEYSEFIEQFGGEDAWVAVLEQLEGEEPHKNGDRAFH